MRELMYVTCDLVQPLKQFRKLTIGFHREDRQFPVDLLNLYHQQRESLADIVVQLASDALPFLLLRLDQARRKVMQDSLCLLQFLLGFFAASDIFDHRQYQWSIFSVKTQTRNIQAPPDPTAVF